MKLHIIDAGNFLCDGGGIFGGVPKVLWSRQVPADERNMIKLAMRCLLVETENRNILIETGAGNKLSKKFIENNGIEDPNRLISSLAQAGFSPEDITDVVHTHLHWDHCGGGTRFDAAGDLVTTYQNATYHCTRSQWENALNPNPREGDAYFENDLLPLLKSGQLNLIDNETALCEGITLKIYNGHTPGMLVPIIDFNNTQIAYVTDLIPTVANIPLKWIAAYDLLPVTAMAEKEQFSKEAIANNYVLFFEHDVESECATLRWDERKGPMVNQKGKLEDFG